MLPLRDETQARRPALVTMLIIAACVAVFVFVQPSAVRSISGVTYAQLDENARFNYENAVIPCELVQGRPLTVTEIAIANTTGESDACIDNAGRAAGQELFADKNVWLAAIQSLFLHGSWWHLAGNMLFLWVFAKNVEARMGFLAYAVFYVAAGVVATTAHVVAELDSVVPLVGASGAVAGVMGVFLAWFPLARMSLVVMVGFIPVPSRLPAFVLLVIWFVSQFFIGSDSGVAWIAHVAGFLFGFLVGLSTRPRRRPPSFAGTPGFGGPTPPLPQAPYSSR